MLEVFFDSLRLIGILVNRDRSFWFVVTARSGRSLALITAQMPCFGFGQLSPQRVFTAPLFDLYLL